MLSHLVLQIGACLLLCQSLFAITEFGVTYDFSGGRFGDCLLSYLHAKWIAYQKDIPLFYKPFQYSSQLRLHECEKYLSDLRGEPRIRVRLDGGPLNPGIRLPVLYICPYFPEDAWELTQHKWPYSFQVDWKDPQFRQIVRSLVEPRYPLILHRPPEGFTSIAIHFREGGGFDDQSAYEGWPMKFPPLHFYIDSLLAAIDLSQEKPIYCYVFTDAVHPEGFVHALQQAIPPQVPIQFNYRKVGNHHRSNVLEDFFSFFHFDILIRPQSNFSIVASLLHDFVAVYSPEEFTKTGSEVKITKIRIERPRENSAP